MFSELWFGLVFEKEMGIAAKIRGFHNFFFALKFSLKFGERNGLQFEEILRIFPPTDACPTFKPTDVLPNTFRYILKKVRKKYLP